MATERNGSRCTLQYAEFVRERTVSVSVSGYAFVVVAFYQRKKRKYDEKLKIVRSSGRTCGARWLYIDWFKRTWTPRPARPERRVRRYRKGDRCSRETVLKISRVRPENRRRVQRFRSCSPRCCTVTDAARFFVIKHACGSAKCRQNQSPI